MSDIFSLFSLFRSFLDHCLTFSVVATTGVCGYHDIVMLLQAFKKKLSGVSVRERRQIIFKIVEQLFLGGAYFQILPRAINFLDQLRFSRTHKLSGPISDNSP